MSTSQGSQRIEAKPLSQDSHEVQSKNQNHAVVEAPGQDPGPSFIVHSNNKKTSLEDIKLVQHLIECCLQLYMNKRDAVRTLSNRARIEPNFIALVWQKLEEENSDFFRAYYIRLKLKKEIILFNQFLQELVYSALSPECYASNFKNYKFLCTDHVCGKIMKKHKSLLSLSFLSGNIHFSMHAVEDLQIGYPVLQPPIPNTLQLHIGPTSFGLPSCQANNGTLAPGTSHPGQMNNDEPSKAAVASACQCKAMPSMPEMAATPDPVALNDHLRFVPPEIPMGPDASATDTAFTSDIDLEFSRDSLRSLGNNWNFSLSDLTTDLTNLGELGDTGDYSGSPILPSDKDIFLNDTDRDAIVEYFPDPITSPSSQSDEG